MHLRVKCIVLQETRIIEVHRSVHSSAVEMRCTSIWVRSYSNIILCECPKQLSIVNTGKNCVYFFIRLESKANLKENLPLLGMMDLFDENKADLSGMHTPAEANKKPYVSDVFHQATIGMVKLAMLVDRTWVLDIRWNYFLENQNEKKKRCSVHHLV